MAVDKTAGNQLHLSVLTPDSVKRIHAASLEILERTGILFESEEARQMLRGAGARVDGLRVRIPSYLVERAIESAPKRVTICNRDGDRWMHLEGHRSYFTGIVDCPQILDPFSRTRRAFTSKDYQLICAAIEGSPNIFGAGGGGSAQDYPPDVRAQVAFKYSMLNMKKPFMSCPLTAEQMADVYDMAAVMAGGYD